MDGRKNGLIIFGFFATRQELTEITLMHHVAKSATRLVKNFLAVGNKKQLQSFASLLAETPVIQGRENGLAGTGGGYRKVAMPPVGASIRNLFKHAFLMGERVYIQQGGLDIVP